MAVFFGRASSLLGILFSCAFLCVLIAASLTLFCDERNVAAVWFALGFQAAILTLTGRNRAYIVAMFVTALATMLFLAVPPILAFGAAVSNGAIATWSAWILASEKDWIKGHEDRLRPWLLFAFAIGLVAPAVNALVGSSLTVLAGVIPPVTEYWLMATFTWFISGALGVAIVTPTVIRLGAMDLRQLPGRQEILTSLGVIAFVAALFLVISLQDNILPIFFVVPVLIVVLYALGMTTALICLAVFVTASIAATVFDAGPFMELSSLSRFDPLIICQAYAMAMFYTVVLFGGLLEEGQYYHKVQLANANIYEMLAKRSGDIVFAADAHGRILFISPSIGDVLEMPFHAIDIRNWRNYVVREDVKKIYNTALRVIRSDKPAAVDFRIVDSAGQQKILEAVVQASNSGNRRKAMLIGSTRDVTVQRQHEDNLSRLSETDPLTELPNRRSFDKYYRAEWSRSFASNAPMSMLMIDVDYFKQFNDTFGHQSGDECLVVIGHAIRRALKRDGDFCARFGGEEFVAILPDTDERNARQVAARVLSSIAHLKMAHPQSPYGIVTVSIGIASSKPLRVEPDIGLLEAADTALYLAKQQGRNRAEFARGG